METLKIILDYFGYGTSILGIVTIVVAVFSWFNGGIVKVVINLGRGLAGRKIAIFAKGDQLNSLSNMLTDSGLIRKKNIIEIALPEDIERAGSASVFLLNWTDWQDNYKMVIEKASNYPLIVYAQDIIPPAGEAFKDFKAKSNAYTVNFRGRLLSDIFMTMITTKQNKK